MISVNLQKAINSQINAELWSAYLYLSMSMDAETKGLHGVANWFYIQWLEEQDHARIFQKYLHSQDVPVILQPIAAVPTGWDSHLQLFLDALDHEKEVTAMIGTLAEEAYREKDFATLGCLRWFVDEQVEEEQSVRDILDTLRLIGDDSYGLYQIDSQLGKRTYKKHDTL
ncbi:MAG: ferritin [Paludibacteraceae bacterium]|nr:ferritin [Paludibacteraceae bacterium]